MKTKERIKTLLLCVLIAGAGFLTYSIWFYDMPGADGIFAGGYEYNEQTFSDLMMEESTSEIVPFTITYHNAKGRFGAAYHEDSVARLYQKTQAILREALSTISHVEKCEQTDWESALSEYGILYDFEGVIPLASLAMQIGAENSERLEHNGRYLAFTDEFFFLKNPDTNEHVRLKHGLAESELRRVMDGMSAATCTLAMDGENNLVAETLIFDNPISAFTINGYNPVSFFSESQMITLLKVFGMNYNTCGKYTEQDGTQVYIEDLDVLKIAPDGFVVYSSDAEHDEDASGIAIASAEDYPTFSEILKSASGVIARLSYLAGGAGSTYMQSIENTNGEYNLRFGWSFGGIPIDRVQTGYSALIKVSDRRITDVEFYMRSYESSGSVVSVIPQKLAIAMVDDDDTSLGLRYTDAGTSGIAPQWYVKMK